VHTKKEDAGGVSGKDRYFAVVVGASGKRLDEALLEAGLARAYGMGADWPKGVRAERFLPKLHPFQSAAQRTGAGVWKKK
jgi:endonuclease YncB( thermonuclease family)